MTLSLYPRHLREQFGDEMALVFEEQLEDARGAVDAARVCLSAIKELWTVALPNRIAPVLVPTAAFVAALVYFVGMLGLIHVARGK